MGRKCAVANCNNTDQTILSHRFPRQIKNSEIWRKSLKINNIPVNELITKYIVCSLHFKKSDYRNERSHHLNFTAIPQLTRYSPDKQDIVNTNHEQFEKIITEEDVGVEIKLLKSDNVQIYNNNNKRLINHEEYKKSNEIESFCVTNNQIDLNEISMSLTDDFTNDCIEEDTEDILENDDQINEKFINTVYAKLNKNQLIELLLNNETKINNLENEVNKYKTAHENIVKNMENFKQLMIIN